MCYEITLSETYIQGRRIKIRSFDIVHGSQGLSSYAIKKRTKKVSVNQDLSLCIQNPIRSSFLLLVRVNKCACHVFVCLSGPGKAAWPLCCLGPVKEILPPNSKTLCGMQSNDSHCISLCCVKPPKDCVYLSAAFIHKIVNQMFTCTSYHLGGTVIQAFFI